VSKKSYDQGMTDAHGDADTMLGVSTVRIQELERELAAMTAERDALREELRRNDHDIVVMTAAKDKAVNMLKCTDDGPRTRECYSAVTGRDYEADMAELEEVK